MREGEREPFHERRRPKKELLGARGEKAVCPTRNDQSMSFCLERKSGWRESSIHLEGKSRVASETGKPCVAANSERGFRDRADICATVCMKSKSEVIFPFPVDSIRSKNFAVS